MRFFHFSEFISHGDTLPDFEEIANLEMLVLKILDPLRMAYGAPININSGYRSPEKNKAIGGAQNSQHCRGMASDITAGSKEKNKILFDLIKKMNCFDQLIDEKDFQWVHVSYHSENGNRKQVLKL